MAIALWNDDGILVYWLSKLLLGKFLQDNYAGYVNLLEQVHNLLLLNAHRCLLDDSLNDIDLEYKRQ